MAFGVLSGSRAKVGFFNKDKNFFSLLGTFSDISYNVAYDVQPAWVLGREAAAATENVAQELIQINATGWRVVNKSIFTEAQFPRLSELISAGYLTFSIQDRQSGLTVATIDKVRPTHAAMGFSARMLSSVTYTYLGILYSDEQVTDNDVRSDAVPMID
jgi:hypothetical protein